jgi:uroporphyrinogen decarboxylase
VNGTVAGRAAAGLVGPGGVQGNLDPAVLADQRPLRKRAENHEKKAGPVGHVMNLGHGVEAAPRKRMRISYRDLP